MTTKNLLIAVLLLGCFLLYGGDTQRPGLERLSWEYGISDSVEQALVMALKDPLLQELNVEAALQQWFDGRLLHSQNKQEAAREKWHQGMTLLDNLQPLPPLSYGAAPKAEFSFLSELKLPNFDDVQMQVVSWQVNNLRQYGLLLAPRKKTPGQKYPLILYGHGAAFGLPNSFCAWLAQHLVRKGYIVAAPALRGEPLFQMQIPINGKELVCDGEIENLDGEVDDCLAMLDAAWKLPYVRKDEFAMLGHSFGAGVSLLAVARMGEAAKAAVSYDAWLVNPQRYYWDRMRRGANNWLSWEDYCNQPVKKQLRGLQKRSLLHHVEGIQAPLLLFMGGGYEGSVFHLSHEDLCKKLKAHNKKYRYVLVPNGDHNFVLRDGAPARFALPIQQKFLQEHYPAN
ncbi:MAG: prolyl oligopeptidase family serine peptidase [Lentisphaeria bacterium]|nr:prolyl oligopeptidase family serine peptidase [Lentisphaeria bacterium]MDY0175799.1 prolyl oligopeptidase family serine peptidase [Lentisphaeria bacterium]NLZ61138.1 prolyl oligopeptidase family serine peptidase [Lentisphaerota bacterium]